MARKKVKSVAGNGLVQFIDERTDKEVDGTKDDCLAYGYDYVNSKCYAFSQKREKVHKANIQAGNTNQGKSNIIKGSNNSVRGNLNAVIGNNNTILTTNSTAIGNGMYVENSGVIALGNSLTRNRARFSIVNFVGTTTDDAATEILIGGYNSRFNINTNYETAYAIDYTATALNASSNEIWTEYGHVTFKYVNGTLTEVGHQTGHTIRDSALDYDVSFGAVTTPTVHIAVRVTGEREHTAYWNVVTKITEVRYG